MSNTVDQTRAADAVVAGHICVDIIPLLHSGQQRAEDIFIPGQVVDVGPATISLGGAVSNAGQALHRLGLVTRLIGKVGEDALGQLIKSFLSQLDPALAEHLVISPGDASSYTLVLNPPGVDRCFLHCTGANDTFRAAECPLEIATSGRVFHFGYPQLMREIYSDGGAGLADLMRQVQSAGVLTSLDMAFPDPASAAGDVDWNSWLDRVLPYVDVFLPSFDETVQMLDPSRYRSLSEQAQGRNPASFADIELVSSFGEMLAAKGPAIVGLKLGDEGLYLKTHAAGNRLSTKSLWQGIDTDTWTDQELIVPCFQVEAAGTTGSGDCTVAGFLAALLHHHTPADAATRAVAVGAFNVENPDATSGIVAWEDVQSRIQSGWPRRTGLINLRDWQFSQQDAVYRPPD